MPFSVSSQQTPCPVCGRTTSGCKQGEGGILCRLGNTFSPFKVHSNLRKMGDKVTGADGAIYALKKVDESASCPYALFGEHEEREPRVVTQSRRWQYNYLDGRDGTATKIRDDYNWGEKETRWSKGSKPAELAPLYYDELPAAGSGELVFLVEGEACCDALRELGLSVTSVPSGSSSWKSGVPDLEKFHGNRLVLCPDRDRVGVALMERVAEAYPEAEWLLAQPSATAEWSDPDDGYDVADWIEDGATVDSILEAITDLAPSFSPVSDDAPYRMLGWSSDRTRIYAQVGATQQTTNLPRGLTKQLLLTLAPQEHWRAIAPKIDRDGQVVGVSWDTAIDQLLRVADAAGVYSPLSERGTGVWMDAGRVVWNKGDCLLVDGTPTAHFGIAGDYTYMRLPRLGLAKPSPFDGVAILDAVRRMGWKHHSHHLYVVGWAVVAPIAGSLRVRPGLAVTSATASGKSTTCKRVLQPLTGGLAWYNEGMTSEAGVRQHCGTSSIPVVLDEAEQEVGQLSRLRDGLVKLNRSCYSGEAVTKGSQSGQAVTFTAKLMMAFSAINFPLPNPADRNRYAIVRRNRLGKSEWAAVEPELLRVVTPGAGAALVHSAVAQLPVLLGNVEVFARVLAGLIDREDANRWGDTLGTLLAGAAWAEAQVALTDADALDWLDRHAWEFDQAEIGSDVEVEGDQCLDFLLSRPVRWSSREDPSGERTVHELLHKGEDSAKKALERYGLKLLDVGLFVANPCERTARLFKETKWAGGTYKERLLELPGVEVRSSGTWCGGKNRRGVVVPTSLWAET